VGRDAADGVPRNSSSFDRRFNLVKPLRCIVPTSWIRSEQRGKPPEREALERGERDESKNIGLAGYGW
jgi:hypothetical protein